MRCLFPIALLAVLLAGCTAYIPVKDGFGTSALRRSGKTPPEYAAFNNYDPGVNALLAEQMCATPYVLLEQKTHPAVPGELITWRGPCQPFVLMPDTLAEYLLPERPLLAWRAPVAPGRRRPFRRPPLRCRLPHRLRPRFRCGGRRPDEAERLCRSSLSDLPRHRRNRMARSVLVTGGAGYVGSHACKVLAGAGYLPVTYDNLSRGHREAVRWGPLIEGDTADRARLLAAIKQHQIGAVLHFAAFAYVGESVADPALYYRNNLVGSLALIEAMRESGIDKIVFSSTCATYGVPDAVPIPESAPQLPVNPYGETKLAVERALYWYAAHGLRSVSLRYFNAAGADPAGEIGERHDPETHLIPLVLEAALGKRPFVEIYGTDYPTPDGTAIRDYVHVADLAAAHVLALDHLAAGGTSLRLNLGTGSGHSVRAVIAAAERISGRSVPYRTAPRRPGDPPVLVADARLAAERLGWRPAASDLDTILSTALAWHLRQ